MTRNFVAFSSFLIIGTLSSLPAGETAEATEIGRKLGKDISDFIQGNFEDAITKPATGGDKIKVYGKDEMVDNDFHLTCGGEEPEMFLKASYTSTSTGEINLITQISPNLNGQYNTVQIRSISRVCLSGFAQKISGVTKYYKWNYNNSLLGKTVIASPSELQGCYCINDECGSPSVIPDRKSQILSDIVGGIYPIVANKSSLVISRGDTTSDYVTLYGQSKMCNEEDKYGINEIDNDNFEDKINLTTGEQADPTSFYYKVSTTTSSYTLSAEDKQKLDDINDDTKKIKAGSSHQDGTSTISLNADDLSIIDGPITAVMDIGVIDQPIAQYCEVRWSEEDTSVFEDGSNRENSTEENTQEKLSIRECTDDFTICPIDASKGEIIKHDCGQIDDFAEVTSKFAAISESLKDTICSKIEED